MASHKTISPLSILILLFILSTSCSKDSDLFDEQIQQQIEKEIEEQLTEEEEEEEEEETDYFDDGLKVFPGAKGFGADWTFPKNTATFINVTNLNDSGPGSLRQAMADADGTNGTIITFYGLSGYIDALSMLNTTIDNIYIAGQTSPNGIVIRKASSGDFKLFRISSSNIILRDLIFAFDFGETEEFNGDCLSLNSGISNVVIDKVEAYFAVDENIAMGGRSQDITLQNSISAYPLGSTSGKGIFVANGMDRSSYYGNLLAHSFQRNMEIGGGPIPRDVHEIDMHVNYNCGAFRIQLGSVLNTDNLKINLTNFVDISGSETFKSRRPVLINSNTSVYVNSLWGSDFKNNSSQDDWLTVGTLSNNGNSEASVSQRRSTPYDYPMSNNPIRTRQEIVDYVTKNAGSSNNWFGLRERIINEMNNNTGSSINNESEVGGFPPAPENGAGIADSDNDGIPNSEEGYFTTLFDYVNNLALLSQR